MEAGPTAPAMGVQSAEYGMSGGRYGNRYCTIIAGNEILVVISYIIATELLFQYYYYSFFLIGFSSPKLAIFSHKFVLSNHNVTISR